MDTWLCTSALQNEVQRDAFRAWWCSHAAEEAALPLIPDIHVQHCHSLPLKGAGTSFFPLFFFQKIATLNMSSFETNT